MKHEWAPPPLPFATITEADYWRALIDIYMLDPGYRYSTFTFIEGLRNELATGRWEGTAAEERALRMLAFYAEALDDDDWARIVPSP